MPTYTPRPLSWNQYVRSASPTIFGPINRVSCICWMDLLGVRQMTHQQILNAVDDALWSAAAGSSTGLIDQNNVLIGTPNNALQFSLIGDALVLVERDYPDTPAAATLGFIYRVNIIARLLNEKNLLHRAVITTGEVRCSTYEGSAIITGAGVVKAAQLEGTLKAAGIFYDDAIAKFIKVRQAQIDNQNFCVDFSSLSWNSSLHAPGLAGVCFSQFQGWEYWKQNVYHGIQSNNKVINTIALLSELKQLYNLP